MQVVTYRRSPNGSLFVSFHFFREFPHDQQRNPIEKRKLPWNNCLPKKLTAAKHRKK